MTSSYPSYQRTVFCCVVVMQLEAEINFWRQEVKCNICGLSVPKY